MYKIWKQKNYASRNINTTGTNVFVIIFIHYTLHKHKEVLQENSSRVVKTEAREEVRQEEEDRRRMEKEQYRKRDEEGAELVRGWNKIFV